MMYRIWPIFPWGLALVTMSCSLDFSPFQKVFVLAEEGASEVSILLATDADRTESFAAEELQHYVERVTGVRLPIVKGTAEKNSPAIVIGAPASEVSGEPDLAKGDHYRILSVGSQIYLLGGSSRAVLYGVYDFLERYLDCGWVFPGDDALPQKPTVKLELPISIVETPAYDYRAMMLFPFNMERSIEDIDWMAKNRLNTAHVAVNSSREGPVLGLQLWQKPEVREQFLPELEKRGLSLHFGGHTFFVWVPPERYFQSHPEYFSLVDGERVNRALCISHPDLPGVAAQNMIEFLKDNPEVDIIDCWNNDTGDWCQCRSCEQMEGVSRESIIGRDISAKTDSALEFVNAVAARVKEHFPHLQVSFLAYARVIDAPLRVKPADNVQVGFAPISRAPRSETEAEGYYDALYDYRDEINRRHLAELKRWVGLTDRLYTYDYFTRWRTLSNGRKALEGRQLEFYPLMNTMPKDLWFYRHLGIQGVSTEQMDWNEINMYFYPRLAWEPNQSATALVDRYCMQSYGQAYLPMLDHWLALAEARQNWRQEQERCLQLIEAALNVVEGTQQRARIERIQSIWEGHSADEPFRNTSPYPFEP